MKEYAEYRRNWAGSGAFQRNIAKHRQEYAQMQELLQEVMRQLPESKDIPNLLRSMTSVTEETRLKVKQFEPKQIKHTDFYSELPFEMKFREGSGTLRPSWTVSGS